MVNDGYESADALIVSSFDSEKEWILDSGSTFHMTPNKSWFKEFKQGVGEWSSWATTNHVRCKELDQ